MALDAVEMSGMAPATAARKPSRQYPKDRVCAEPECQTILSIYNDSDFCVGHSDSMKRNIRVRGRRY